MTYGLPNSVNIGGVDCEIRADFRAALDILEALSDDDLDDGEKVLAALDVFLFNPPLLDVPDEYLEEAYKQLTWFISGGAEEKGEKKPQPRLMDWKQDFPLIIAPVNRILGYDARGVPYNPKTNQGGLHWWTFLSAYQEIGDCLFAQVVGIRRKKQKGVKLDKSENEFYARNVELIELKRKYTQAEDETINAWL